MQLPNTENSLICWIDPAEKFVTKNSSNKVTSMINRLNGNIMSSSSATQYPTWVDNSINGQPSLLFSGGQNLNFNLGNNVSSIGTRIPFMMTCVAKCSSFSPLGNILFCGGNTTLGLVAQAIEFGNVGINLIINLKQTNTGGGILSPFNIPADTSYHVYTSVYDGTNLKLRVDGIQIDNLSATSLNSLSSSINQITIGDWCPAAAVVAGHAYFTGNIATMVAYIGSTSSSLDFSHETYLKDFYNL